MAAKPIILRRAKTAPALPAAEVVAPVAVPAARATAAPAPRRADDASAKVSTSTLPVYHLLPRHRFRP